MRRLVGCTENGLRTAAHDNGTAQCGARMIAKNDCTLTLYELTHISESRAVICFAAVTFRDAEYSVRHSIGGRKGVCGSNPSLSLHVLIWRDFEHPGMGTYAS
jgi:hypothetical protein